MDLEEQAVFFLLLALAAGEDQQGVIPLCLEDIAWSLRVPFELAERVVQKCMDRDILSVNGKGYKFIHWQTRQFPSDNVTERVQRWREGKKSETLHITLHETLPETLQKRCMKQDCNNADRYVDREIETISMSPTATEQSKTEDLSVCVSTETTPHDAIVSLYHEILPELPAVKEWTPERFLDEDVAPMPIFGKGHKAHVTSSCHDAYGRRNVIDAAALHVFIKKLNDKIEKHRDEIVMVKADADGADTVLVAYGSVFRCAQAAVDMGRAEGLRLGWLKLGTIWPFADKEIAALAGRVKHFIVLENNLGQIVPYVQAAAAGKATVSFLPPRVLGELHEIEDVLKAVREVRA